MQQLAQSQPSPTTITIATQSQLENEPGTGNDSDDGSPEWYQSHPAGTKLINACLADISALPKPLLTPLL
ncbi:hypothetical protein EB796_008000 [Bugula neritina]|uniref:Uncharacterized protein n=1 Tax=Bugula neritina TaxID=10212 RepID=A0A7J7K7U4_BUGNE|nr:hypothetical protein EB796_024367 [Bugula neritina]KAF6033698.1 hypothetical protein EB796_008000 [Bugula neritina]